MAWIEHESTSSPGDGERETPVETGRGMASRRPAADTASALLAARVGGAVGPARGEAAGASATRTFSFQPREATPAERAEIMKMCLASEVIRWCRELAMSTGQTIVIGMGADESCMLASAAVGGGLYFGPNGEIGISGAVSSGLSSNPVSLSVSVEITVLDGGPELLEGEFLQSGVAGGEIWGLGLGCIMNLDREIIGFTGQVGLALGVEPVEAFVRLGTGVRSEL